MIFIDFETTGLPESCLRDREVVIDEAQLRKLRQNAIISYVNGDIAKVVIPQKHQNGHTVEVLSLTAIITDYQFNIKEKITRYYYHSVALEQISEAISINHLTHDKVTQLRAGKVYPRTYLDDLWFWDNLFSAELNKFGNSIYAHNMSFDSLFLPEIWKEYFNLVCTAQLAKEFFGSKKYIKLKECCGRLGIEYSEEEAHFSEYDVLKMIQMLKALNKRF